MLELPIIKQHCRVEPDIAQDDALLTVYLNAAVEHVQQYTGRTLYETLAEVPVDDEDEPVMDFALVYNDAVRAAMLLMIGHWYVNREAVTGDSVNEVPMGTEALLRPYRILGV